MYLQIADAASSQASDWAAFAPHPIRQVTVPTRRTLTFDSSASDQPRLTDTPQLELQTKPQAQTQTEAQAQTQTELQAQTQAEPQRDLQEPQIGSGLCVRPRSGHVVNPEGWQKPRFNSHRDLLPGAEQNELSRVSPDQHEPATPVESVATAGGSSAVTSPSVATPDKGHTTAVTTAAIPPATAAEPETPSARDIALKGPALAFSPEWSHSTASSSNVRTADTAASANQAVTPAGSANIIAAGIAASNSGCSGCGSLFVTCCLCPPSLICI